MTLVVTSDISFYATSTSCTDQLLFMANFVLSYQLVGILNQRKDIVYFLFILQNGKTALHYAAYKGLLASVKALIEAGADLDITDEVQIRLIVLISARQSTILSGPLIRD